VPFRLLKNGAWTWDIEKMIVRIVSKGAFEHEEAQITIL
jgi:hypothetical protein